MLGPGRQNVISTGNETFDKFLGGGLLNSTLNIFERQGPSSRILDAIITKSFAATTLTEKKTLLYVNFNTSLSVEKEDLLASLPSQRKVKSELLYKDIAGRSELAKIKIAWRYSNRNTFSPSDGVTKVNQVDFGVSLIKTIEPEDLGRVYLINIQQYETLDKIASTLRQTILDIKRSNTSINVIVKDLLHPFSPLIDQQAIFLKFIYFLRCLSRFLTKGAIIVVYDSGLCTGHRNIEQNLYSLADSVVSFHSYETAENLLTGYKDIDGSLSYIKVPKINSFGFHFQQGLSDWGYRLTKSNRFFVIDELSLPPCGDDDSDQVKTKKATPIGQDERRQATTACKDVMIGGVPLSG